jgi:hypothetical protein
MIMPRQRKAVPAVPAQPAIPFALDPTRTIYADLANAYDFFNERLFGGRLPRCLILISAQARQLQYEGRFTSKRLGSPDGSWVTDTIELNSQCFKDPLEKTLSTLVHEMCHLEQAHFGKLPGDGKHDAEWAAMMKAVGLQNNTSIIPGGPFELAAADLIKSGFTLPVNPQRKVISEDRIAFETAINYANAFLDELAIKGNNQPEDFASTVKYHLWLHRINDQISEGWSTEELMREFREDIRGIRSGYISVD